MLFALAHKIYKFFEYFEDPFTHYELIIGTYMINVQLFII